ncbi:MAG: STAS domain-containing protein [Candidatus Hydrogenedentota bacterium]
MEMNKEYLDNIVIIKCEKIMDINVLKDLDKVFKECLNANDIYLVLDLIDTKFLDSIIAGKILAMLKLFHAKGGDIKLLNPQLNVIQALKTLGVIGLIDIYDNIDEIKKSFTQRELEKEELEFIKKEVIKKILIKYDGLCTDITIEDRLQAAIEGRYVPNIERDLNIVDMFSKKKMVLFDNVDEFCEHLEKYFRARSLSFEDIKNMKNEMIKLNEYYLKALNKEINIEELYKIFDIGKFDAINRKLEQLKKMIEE